MAQTELKFTLQLHSKPTSPILIVAGGADANGNGEISNADEVKAFTNQGNNTWLLDQNVDADPNGMLFAVTFTVGSGVPWTLDIFDVTNKKSRFLSSNTSTSITTVVTFGLAKL